MVAEGTVTVRADAFSMTGIATITGGWFEYAPNQSEVVTLGAGGNLVDLTGIGTSSVRIGAANGSVTATGITTAGSFDLGTGNGGAPRPLDLQATGNVSDGGSSPFLNVSTLTGTISGGSLSLTALSAGIDTIGTFTVSGAGNGFTLNQPSGTLTVAGPLNASTVTLGADSLTIGGAISTGGPATGSVALNANGGTISGAGVITTGTLSGYADADVALTGTNQIGTLGSFSAETFNLNNGVAIVVGNTVSATAVGLTAASIAINGLVTDGGFGTVGLVATNGSITESGTIVAGTLSGSAGTSASLAQAANQIGIWGHSPRRPVSR